jgi:pyruvate/2-oxoglutarate dehydrogenase complex dihydrolipoamide acyltransferase (E2) component
LDKDILPIPNSRSLAVDALKLTNNRLICHDFLEADVTIPRRILKGTSGSDNRSLSFTAYIIACYASALRLHPALQALRDIRNRQVIFHDVDVSTIIDHKAGGGIPIPRVIRRVQAKSVREISEEIRRVQADPHPLGRMEGLFSLATHIPRPLRVLFFHVLKLNPDWIKQFDGTTLVSSFGMYGRGLTWGVGNLYFHTIGLWVGSITRKPMIYKGRVAPRECLYLALSIDHEMVDGAPLARFVSTLVEFLESGVALEAESV